MVERVEMIALNAFPGGPDVPLSRPARRRRRPFGPRQRQTGNGFFHGSGASSPFDEAMTEDGEPVKAL